ncbi:MAG: hypothetical protein Unbinned4098contig1000_19 [Prokaryotic dsDNA virus sp.]|nr:MAG: hypothetical protein Unbinned4098contig1000_19 [Prokaryotic dsDNA virus sp.]|tara:strand:- start:2110 stop:2553 length:444 start_codon:yes stop_codon:yes gene_type:complete
MNNTLLEQMIDGINNPTWMEYIDYCNGEDTKPRLPHNSCYQHACTFVLREVFDGGIEMQKECGDLDLSKALLVHGRPKGVQYGSGHAWVEVGDKVIETTRIPCRILDKKEFYRLSMVEEKDIRRYTKREAMNMLGRHRHWGDWHLDK